MFADLDADDDMFAAAARPDSAAEVPAASERIQQDGDQRPAGGATEHGGASNTQPGPSIAGHAAPAEPSADVDYSTWPVKELKRFLTERGEVCSLSSVFDPQLSAFCTGSSISGAHDCSHYIWALASSRQTSYLEKVISTVWSTDDRRQHRMLRHQDASQIVEKDDLVARVKAVASRGPEGEEAAAPAGYELDPASGYYYSTAAGMYYDASSGGYYDGTKWYSFDSASQQLTEWPV